MSEPKPGEPHAYKVTWVHSDCGVCGLPFSAHPESDQTKPGEDEALRIARHYRDLLVWDAGKLAQAIREYGERQREEAVPTVLKEHIALRAEVAALQEKLQLLTQNHDDLHGRFVQAVKDGASLAERIQKAEAALEGAKAAHAEALKTHHAAWEKQYNRAELIAVERDSLRDALEVERGKVAQWVSDFNSLANTLAAERGKVANPVSREEANELQDILRTLTNSGTALKTSARELVKALAAEREAHEKTKAMLETWHTRCLAHRGAEKRIEDLEGALRARVDENRVLRERADRFNSIAKMVRVAFQRDDAAAMKAFGGNLVAHLAAQVEREALLSPASERRSE